jgi:hypothetical protein
MSTQVECDFGADWIAFCRANLVEIGSPVDPALPDEEVTILFFNAQMRLVEPRARTIHESPGLAIPQHLAAAYATFLAKVRQGDDLRPHLSSLVTKADRDDALLNDWGIHHFHLGTQVGPKGFVDRTGELLFAMVREGDFYVVSLFNHDLFSAQAVLESAHASWPQLIASWRRDGFQLAAPLSDSERKEARGAGLLAFTQMKDGTLYASPGGGYATSKRSTEAVTRSDRTMTTIWDLEEKVRARGDDLAGRAKAKGAVVTSPLRVSLEVTRDGEAVLPSTPRPSCGSSWNPRFSLGRTESEDQEEGRHAAPRGTLPLLRGRHTRPRRRDAMAPPRTSARKSPFFDGGGA